VRGLIEYEGNSFVRCCGFLYVRYVCQPEYIWNWMKRYLFDEEVIQITADGK